MRRAWCGLAALAAVLLLPCARTLAEPEETPPPDLSVSDGVSAWTDTLDWAELERLMALLPNEVRALWGGMGAADTAREIAQSGTWALGGAGRVWSAIGALLETERKALWGTAAALVGLTLMGGIVGSLGGDGKSGVQDAAGFVCRCFTLSAVLAAFAGASKNAVEGLRIMCGCMEAATPVLMTLLTALGGTASVGVYQPAMALLSGSVGKVMEGVVAPLTMCAGLLGLFEQVAERVRLGELSGLIRTCLKWAIGLMGTLYAAVTTLGGMTAAAFDGVTVRTAKYAAGSLLPMAGSLVTGSFDVALGCAALVKNAVGLTSVLICVGLMLSPMVKLAATMLMLRIAAAITEPIADKKQTGMLRVGADMMGMLLTANAVAMGMFLITVGLVTGVGGVGWIG